MKTSFAKIVVVSLIVAMAALQGDAKAQMPDPPGPEIDLLKKDVGE